MHNNNAGTDWLTLSFT